MIQPLTADLANSFGSEKARAYLSLGYQRTPRQRKRAYSRGDAFIAYRIEPVTNVGIFRNRVALTQPGSWGEWTILREGKQKILTVTNDTLTKERLIAQSLTQSIEELGMSVQTLTPELAEQSGSKTKECVVVTEVETKSIAARAGIVPGTVTVEVNRKPVKSVDEFKSVSEKSSADKRVLLLIMRGETQ